MTISDQLASQMAESVLGAPIGKWNEYAEFLIAEGILRGSQVPAEEARPFFRRCLVDFLFFHVPTDGIH